MNYLSITSSISCMLLVFTLIACERRDQILVDIDGNEYSVIEHEGRLWMAENLRVKHDQKGETIQYYLPNGDQANAATFGLLYDYETACQVCPEGWKLPSNEDWESLLQLENENSAIPFKDADHWNEEVNSNESGFAVRPTGYGNNGEFDNFFGERTYFWSKTDTSEHIWTYIFEKGKNTIRKAQQHPTYALSVRCIKATSSD